MFQSIDSKKNYEKVIEQIQNLILNGTYKNGDKLPPERELTKKLGISRTSLREALKALEVLGLIETKQGGGSYITNNIDSSILKSVSIAFKLNNGTVKDILELRYCLEVQAAKSAALNATEEQVKELEDIVNKMSVAKDEDEKADLDVKFHNKLIKSMNNVLFQIIGDSVSYLLAPFIKDIRKIYYNTEDNLREYYFIKQHKEIIVAIKEKNPKKAADKIIEHIKLTEKDISMLSNDNL